MSLTETRADLFGSLFVLLQHLSVRADAALVRLSLTSRQWLLLAVLSRRFPGTQPTLSQAAEAYGTSRQNVKKIALQLATTGYVELVRDPADRRVTRLRLTTKVDLFDSPDGRDLQEKLLAEAFGSLTAAETRSLLDLIGLCTPARTRPRDTDADELTPAPPPTPPDPRRDR